MTAIELARLRLVDAVDPSLLGMLREDNSHGTVVENFDDLTNVSLRPLSACEDPVELGYIKKLLEMGQVAQLLYERRHKQLLSHKRAKEVKHKLNYIHIARRMQVCAQRLKGPLQVLLVWKIHVRNGNGGERTMLAVVFSCEERPPYGYYFHLKAGLLLCGLLA